MTSKEKENKKDSAGNTEAEQETFAIYGAEDRRIWRERMRNKRARGKEDETEHERERDLWRWQRFMDKIEGEHIDSETMELIERVGERIWRKEPQKSTLSACYGRESDNTIFCPNILGGLLDVTLPSNGDLREKAALMDCAMRLEGIAIGRNAAPIHLWLYNDRPQLTRDSRWNTDKLYLLVSPEEIEGAERDGDEGFLSALAALCEKVGVVYDERAGDGYEYDSKSWQEDVTGPDGLTRTFKRSNWRFTGDADEAQLVPDGVWFLADTIEVCAVTDCYRSFYHDAGPRESGIPVKEDETGLSDEEIDELTAPGSAYWRMYRDHGFYHLLARTCLNDADKEHLDAAMEGVRGRFWATWRLAYEFRNRKYEGKTRKDAESDQMRRIGKVMQDAATIWDHTAGSPGGLYELLDENPSDDEICDAMAKWMDESGCRELVLRAQETGEDIWDLMGKRDDEESFFWKKIELDGRAVGAVRERHN